jgi:hypothetical protein
MVIYALIEVSIVAEEATVKKVSIINIVYLLR